MNEFVVFAAALCRHPIGFHLLDGRVASRCGDGFPEAVFVPGDASLDGLGEVLPQMEPVRDLDRVRCAGAGCFGIGAGAVPADDLRFSMLGEPLGQRRGVTARQQVNDPAVLAVEQNGAVVLASPDGAP